MAETNATSSNGEAKAGSTDCTRLIIVSGQRFGLTPSQGEATTHRHECTNAEGAAPSAVRDPAPVRPVARRQEVRRLGSGASEEMTLAMGQGVRG